MPTNIEIKARVEDREHLLSVLSSMTDAPPERIDQDDTFFDCSGGRLKLRALGPGSGVLIFYRRADEAGPKESYYLHSETPDPDGLRSVLAAAYGAVGRVRKRRDLFRIGRARVHVDRVEGLGDFLELEVPVDDGAIHDVAEAEARRLQNILRIDSGALVKGAYLDLLAAEADPRRGPAEVPGE